MNENRILLDVGGTFVKCSDGRSIPIDSGGSREAIAAALREAVAPLRERIPSVSSGETPAGVSPADFSVGVCIPGPFDYRKGIFKMKHKFAAVYGDSFRELCALPEGVRMGFIHDVNAPLLGLLVRDETLRKGNVALVTFGTGLGFSYAVDGVVQMNEALGPLRSLYDRPFRSSVLEDYVSRRAILKAYGLPVEGDVKEISERARGGEQRGIDAFLSAGEAFGEGARSLLEELKISQIFFGGQIARSFDLMEPAIRRALPAIRLEAVRDYAGATLLGVASIL